MGYFEGKAYGSLTFTYGSCIKVKHRDWGLLFSFSSVSGMAGSAESRLNYLCKCVTG